MTTISFSNYCASLFDLLLNCQVTGKKKVFSLDSGAREVVRMICSAKKSKKKVMIIGNGGSAAIASHMQNDLAKAVGVRSMCFADTSLMTALSNDNGYGNVYEFSVQQWAESGDILVAISSSGKSENITKAVCAAKKRGCEIITLTGFAEENPLRSLGTINFYIRNLDYGYVESSHAILSHFLTDAAMAKIQDEESPQMKASKIVSLV